MKDTGRITELAQWNHQSFYTINQRPLQQDRIAHQAEDGTWRCSRIKLKPLGPRHFQLREMVFPGRRGRDREGYTWSSSIPNKNVLPFKRISDLSPYLFAYRRRPLVDASWSLASEEKTLEQKAGKPRGGFERSPLVVLLSATGAYFATLHKTPVY